MRNNLIKYGAAVGILATSFATLGPVSAKASDIAGTTAPTGYAASQSPGSSNYYCGYGYYWNGGRCWYGGGYYHDGYYNHYRYGYGHDGYYNHYGYGHGGYYMHGGHYR